MTATTTSSTKQKIYYKGISTIVSKAIGPALTKPASTKTTKTIIQTLTPSPTTTSKSETTTQPIPTPKKKFCILWWCL
jgi:hypothetical protein